MSDRNSSTKPFFPNEEDFFGIEGDELLQGKPMELWNPRSSLRSTSPKHDGDVDDIVYAFPLVPVFSTRLQQALAAAQVGVGDIQYLPVRIIQSTGKEIAGYAIANIVTRVPGLDRDQSFMLEEDESEIDPLTERPRVTCIGKLALLGQQLEGHDLARLVEYSPAELVSDRFFEVFRGGKFTGAVCSPLVVS
jgi:hypothetical protein